MKNLKIEDVETAINVLQFLQSTGGLSNNVECALEVVEPFLNELQIRMEQVERV